jgi:long-chain fatty acid transport protein
MAFETGNGSIEADLSYIQLPSVDFEGTVTPTSPTFTSTSSKKENFLIPTFYYVSPAVNNFRFGVALVSPFGLSKRWGQQPGKAVAEEFTLMTYELNPTVAYKINDTLSIGAGLRMLYSEGTVKSNAGFPTYLTRDMTGDGLDFGYNLALTYKPLKELSLATTYRSHIDMKLEGDATLTNSAFAPFLITSGSYSGPASLTAPAPATLSLAAAYTFDEKTTVEFVYDRVYWSKYKQLDFEYQGNKTTMSPLIIGSFDYPIAKNYTDEDSYRLGVTQKFDSVWTGMAGLVYYKTPVPDRTLNFDLPDSDGMAYSVGTRYVFSKQVELGASFLYADRDNRSVLTPTNGNGITGTFSDSKVYLINVAMEYKF